MNLVPLNLQEEKKKFFFDPNYNPQFVYEKDIPESYLYRYGKFTGEHLVRAKAICDFVIKRWGTETAYMTEIGGEILEQEVATGIIKRYIQECGLEEKISLRFSRSQMSRTRVDDYNLTVRLPTTYREKNIYGMLNHEVGTHIFRRINDEMQPWYGKRNQFRLVDYLETEEGISVLHGQLPYSECTLWLPAISYYACSLAQTRSFSGVYEGLRPYIDNPERRFSITFRVKRGVADCANEGGYTKDMLYFVGVHRVMLWLKEHDYDMEKLYLGKVSIEDIDLVAKIVRNTKVRVPPFMSDAGYKEKLKSVVRRLSL